MSNPPKPTCPEETAQPDAEGDTARKRRLAEVFGDVLPDGTSDERADSWGERDGGADDDDWLRNQVPPHHG